jgi:hypothetical protein
MCRYIKKFVKTLLPALLIVSTAAIANKSNLDEALKVYYAGFPDRAITMIKPLASAGNLKAQLLLGNILYSLSRTGASDQSDDPVTWYQMAAAQGSAEANYLLGVTYHNRWAKSKEPGSSVMAIAYYERAVELGNVDAQGPLIQLKFRDRAVKNEAALVEAKTPAIPAQKILPKLVSKKVDKPKKVETPKPRIKMASVSPEPLPANNIQTIIAKEMTSKEGRNNDVDVVLSETNLADIAAGCHNYTQTGFAYYAESIRGAQLIGNATISRVVASTTISNTHLIHLTKNQTGVELLLSLDGVPAKLAKELKQSEKFSIRGIVGNSKKTGSSCNITLVYLPFKLDE